MGAAGAADPAAGPHPGPLRPGRRRWCCSSSRTGSRWDHRGHRPRPRPPRAGRAAAAAPAASSCMAAIAACHADAPSWRETDWLQILTLYDVLVRLDPSPVTHLNRAVALSQVEGADAALAAVDRLSGELARYHLFHAVRAELLRRIGRADDARAGRQSGARPHPQHRRASAARRPAQGLAAGPADLTPPDGCRARPGVRTPRWHETRPTADPSSAGQPGDRRGDPFVGDGQRDPYVLGAGRAVEVARAPPACPARRTRRPCPRTARRGSPTGRARPRSGRSGSPRRSARPAAAAAGPRSARAARRRARRRRAPPPRRAAPGAGTISPRFLRTASSSATTAGSPATNPAR